MRIDNQLRRIKVTRMSTKGRNLLDLFIRCFRAKMQAYMQKHWTFAFNRQLSKKGRRLRAFLRKEFQQRINSILTMKRLGRKSIKLSAKGQVMKSLLRKGIQMRIDRELRKSRVNALSTNGRNLLDTYLNCIKRKMD